MRIRANTRPPPPPTRRAADGLCKPDIRLTGHKVEGYGLSWNQQKAGFLLSGSDDAQICIWDVNAMTQQARVGWGGAGGRGEACGTVVRAVVWKAVGLDWRLAGVGVCTSGFGVGWHSQAGSSEVQGSCVACWASALSKPTPHPSRPMPP